MCHSLRVPDVKDYAVISELGEIFVKKLVLPMLRGITILAVLLLSLPIVLQDFLIFPELTINPRGSVPTKPSEPVESFFVETDDNQKIEVWRLAAASKARASAIIFHGNGGNISSAMFMQRRLSQAGFNTYSFDYRGYGQSSGWPSEEGLYSDASAVWKAVLTRENTLPQQVVLVAHSLGTGIASNLAMRVNPGALLMFSPYSSMTDVVSERDDYHYYAPFLFYSFPTLEYLRHTPTSCILIAHGGQDKLILPSNSRRIASALADRKNFAFVDDATADHINIFERAAPRLLEMLPKCGFRY